MRMDIDKVSVGMVLVEDVILPNGAILLHSPTTLTASHIETLKKRGITRILVSPPPAGESAPHSAFDLHVQETPAKKEMAKEEDTGTVVEKTAPPAPPKITVSVAFDKLSADLRIEPAGGANEVLTKEDLIAALSAQGVIFGINHFKLDELVKKWANIKRLYDVEKVAVGDPPTPGRQGQLDFKVTCVSSPAHLAAIRESTYCYQLRNTGIPIQRVDKGTVVAKRQMSAPPVPGKNVLGDAIPCDEIIKIEIKVDKSIDVHDDGEVYTASQTGLPYFVDGVLGVAPINFDGTAEIRVSADKMTAELIINPAMEGGAQPSEAAIKELLARKEVCYGIKEAVLRDVIEKLDCNIPPDEPVVIAEGDKPIDGENGTVEFLFNTDSSLKPKVNADGSVDYKNVDLIHSVTAGTPLARSIPPGKGTPGRDVTGKEIPCKDGTPVQLPRGSNTKISDQDPNILVAAVDGNVTFTGHAVEVHEGFTINGDVDYSTGNVRYEKSITVSGDIKAGFSVECGLDLQVQGTIEDADVKVGGNVLCRYGFIGQGKGLIDAKGDVNLSFAKNQTVRARGNIIIAKEALNCTLLSRKAITVSGNPLSVAGGTLLARDSIILRTVGNMSGIKTVLEVGTDFTLVEELQKTEAHLAEMTENCRKLIQTYKRYEQLQAVKKKLPPKDEFLFAKLRNTLNQYTKEIKALENRKRLITEKISDFERAVIKIEYSAMPGTVFKFGERQMIVRDAVIGPKSVRLIRGEIKIL